MMVWVTHSVKDKRSYLGLAVLASARIKFVFDSFQQAGQFDFSGNGRTGGFFEIQSGSIAPQIAGQCWQISQLALPMSPERVFWALKNDIDA